MKENIFQLLKSKGKAPTDQCGQSHPIRIVVEENQRIFQNQRLSWFGRFESARLKSS